MVDWLLGKFQKYYRCLALASSVSDLASQCADLADVHAEDQHDEHRLLLHC